MRVQKDLQLSCFRAGSHYCSPGCPQICYASNLCLPGAGTTGRQQHDCLQKGFLLCGCMCVWCVHDCIHAYMCRIDACECTHGSRFTATPFDPTAHMVELKIHRSHLTLLFVCCFVHMDILFKLTYTHYVCLFHPLDWDNWGYPWL